MLTNMSMMIGSPNVFKGPSHYMEEGIREQSFWKSQQMYTFPFLSNLMGNEGLPRIRRESSLVQYWVMVLTGRVYLWQSSGTLGKIFLFKKYLQIGLS